MGQKTNVGRACRFTDERYRTNGKYINIFGKQMRVVLEKEIFRSNVNQSCIPFLFKGDEQSVQAVCIESPVGVTVYGWFRLDQITFNT